MTYGKCLVCEAQTTPDKDWCDDDFDLCERCKHQVLDTFRETFHAAGDALRAEFVANFLKDRNQE